MQAIPTTYTYNGGIRMKIFSVFGITKSGKTTTIENIIRELRRRNYSVGSVKEIHFEAFKIDNEGTNTDRHRKAGSQLVTARGQYETDILYQNKLSMNEILRAYNHDFVVLEGVEDINAPKIITAHNTEEIEERLDETIIAISGIVSNHMDSYKGIPVINSETDIVKMVDLLEDKVFERLPDFPEDCCDACGYSCARLCVEIIKGNAKREDCIINSHKTRLKINGNEINMVPFVEKILYNAVLGVVGELDGYEDKSKIEITIGL